MFLQDVFSGQAENDNEKKMESSSSTSKYSSLNQHPDSRNASVRPVGLPTNLSSSEALPARLAAALTNPKRTGARVEVGCCKVYSCPIVNASFVLLSLLNHLGLWSVTLKHSSLYVLQNKDCFAHII